MTDRILYWKNKLAKRSPRLVILIVEDNPLDRDILLKLFSEIGAHVLCAPSAERAIAMLNDNFDLCLINLCLPGISGLEFIQHLRQHHPSIPAAIVTGFDPGCLSELGVTHVFSKPFTRKNRDLLLKDFQLSDYASRDVEPVAGVSTRHAGRTASPA